MAISKRFQARAIVSAADHSRLHMSAEVLRKSHIEIIDQHPNPDGTVSVTFAGRGLGHNAIPIPPPCSLTFDEKGVPLLTLLG